MPAASTLAINAMLDGLTVTDASLHYAFPGTTGANELTGGSPAYARKAVTFGAASGGIRTLSSPVTFDIPAANSVLWVGFWNSSTFLYYTPNGGGSPKEFVVVPTTDVFECPAHGYADDQKVVFYGGTTPSPLVEGAVYFVRDSTADTFKVSASAGGSVIGITTNGTSDVQVCAVVEDFYASQATHQLTSAQFGLPL